MRQQTQELKNLPLSFLISAPLNAAIEAQRDSALSTVEFIEEVGFLPKNKKLSLFADTTNTHDVRQAVVSYEQDEIKVKTPGDPLADPPTSNVYEIVKVKRTLQLPFISLLNIPMF